MLLKQIELPPANFPSASLTSSQGSLSSSQELLISGPSKVEQNFTQFLQSLHHYYHGDEELATVFGDDAPFLYRLFNR